MDAVHTVLRKEEMRVQQRCLSESNVLPRSYGQPGQGSDVVGRWGHLPGKSSVNVIARACWAPVRWGATRGGMWNAAERQARRQISHTPSNFFNIFSLI